MTPKLGTIDNCPNARSMGQPEISGPVSSNEVSPIIALAEQDANRHTIALSPEILSSSRTVPSADGSSPAALDDSKPVTLRFWELPPIRTGDYWATHFRFSD